MAKRTDPCERPWNPVEEALVRSVLRPEAGQGRGEPSQEANRRRADTHESQVTPSRYEATSDLLKATDGDSEPMSTQGKPKRSKATKTRKDQGAERIKTSVLLSRSVHIRIGALAGIRGVDKSTLINSLLEEATRGVVVSLRGPLAEGFGAGEVSSDEHGADE